MSCLGVYGGPGNLSPLVFAEAESRSSSCQWTGGHTDRGWCQEILTCCNILVAGGVVVLGLGAFTLELRLVDLAERGDLAHVVDQGQIMVVGILKEHLQHDRRDHARHGETGADVNSHRIPIGYVQRLLLVVGELGREERSILVQLPFFPGELAELTSEDAVRLYGSSDVRGNPLVGELARQGADVFHGHLG